MKGFCFDGRFMKLHLIKSVGLLFLCLLQFTAYAQKGATPKAGYHAPTVAVKLDTTSYQIGSPIQMDLYVNEINEDTKVLLPDFQSDSTASIDLVSVGPIDSAANSLHQRVTLMAFDSGALKLPVFKLLYWHQNQTDSLFTAPVSFYVKGISIDTMKLFHYIKKPMVIPFLWREYLWIYVLGGILLLVMLFLIYWFVIRKQKKANITLAMPTPGVPTHEWALKELKRLAAEQLPNQQQYKLFYTRLTDILRVYIERQFEVAAMESTTIELITALNRKRFDKTAIQSLETILLAADLVKFAKGQPALNEMEQHLQAAEHFILNTIPPPPKASVK